jgi:hypothetical protein
MGQFEADTWGFVVDHDDNGDDWICCGVGRSSPPLFIVLCLGRYGTVPAVSRLLGILTAALDDDPASLAAEIAAVPAQPDGPWAGVSGADFAAAVAQVPGAGAKLRETLRRQALRLP